MSRSGGVFKLNLSTLSYLIVGVFCFLNGIMLGAYFMHKHDASSSAIDTFEKYPSSPSQNIIKPTQSSIEDSVGKPAVKIKESPRTENTPSSFLKKTTANIIKDVYETPNLDSNSDSKSVLIVGGTDGSGTRRVVQVLTDLGVTMVSEDPETYDIHADLVAGWPPVVKPVLKHTHTLNYKPGDLPEHINQQTITSIRKITEQAQSDSIKPQSNRLAVGGALKIKTNAHASAIQYGFKAPVAMTLLPYWTAVLPRVKFMHVLRDGRDIAFSANQGPVEKFYEDMYTKTASNVKDKRIQAIQLWSDWNVGIFQWSLAFIQSLSNNASKPDKGYGYMILHSEDLVSPDIQVRYETMAKMARYVGSDMSADRICCLAVKDSAFMGSHDRSQNAVVSKRYGKWEGITRNNKGLLDQLYGKGKEGLKIFGYDPLRTFGSVTAADAGELLGYRCIKQREECVDPEEKRQQEELVAKVKQSNCNVQVNVDYPGADISSVSMPETLALAESAVFCCEQCKVNPACKFFTVAQTQHVCYLKSSQTEVFSKEQLLSGSVIVTR